uniref:Nascent polypeptide-associated complex subunit beta n=1 Tax=Tanacetum cinerariifolium TaxID=118510 RepID=A0A6L2JIN8_TANCI|nr:hypothetical protein [Tanacetum cinerariifolium]
MHNGVRRRSWSQLWRPGGCCRRNECVFLWGMCFRGVVECFGIWCIIKKKVVHKTTTTDDKKLQGTLRRLGVSGMPSIKEVNIYKDDSAIHFVNPIPKVQASINANTWVVSGSLKPRMPCTGEGAAAATATVEDDDEVPELVPGEIFEAAAEEGIKG